MAHSVYNLPLSLRAIVSADCFNSRETRKHCLTLVSCLNIFVTLFLSFKLLGALVVPLWHLRRPNLHYVD